MALMVEDERHGAVLRRYVVDGEGHFHPYLESMKESAGEAAPLVGGGERRNGGYGAGGYGAGGRVDEF